MIECQSQSGIEAGQEVQPIFQNGLPEFKIHQITHRPGERIHHGDQPASVTSEQMSCRPNMDAAVWSVDGASSQQYAYISHDTSTADRFQRLLRPFCVRHQGMETFITVRSLSHIGLRNRLLSENQNSHFMTEHCTCVRGT